ncbi:unnamed protein product [Adineta ricciae]|uniref:RNI-like protein n=1 Tax=Adineta ricciae TaxID=249248 RepID=A0A814HHG9_ADIRI|nr:unnamed protein product [Adineta ricciae]
MGTSSPASTFQKRRTWTSLRRVFKREISVPPTNIETYLLLFPIPSYHSFLQSQFSTQHFFPQQQLASSSTPIIHIYTQLLQVPSKTLTTLNLSGNRIGAEGAQHIAYALRMNTTLTTLNLSGNRIGAEGAQHIADALRTNTTLTTLNLHQNGIGDEGAQHLADTLRTKTRLTTLNLSWNEIGDEGAQHLADTLRTNTTLTTLNLNQNGIGDEIAEHIADALEKNISAKMI